jgi:hypothetical protein
VPRLGRGAAHGEHGPERRQHRLHLLERWGVARDPRRPRQRHGADALGGREGEALLVEDGAGDGSGAVKGGLVQLNHL